MQLGMPSDLKQKTHFIVRFHPFGFQLKGLQLSTPKGIPVGQWPVNTGLKMGFLVLDAQSFLLGGGNLIQFLPQSQTVGSYFFIRVGKPT